MAVLAQHEALSLAARISDFIGILRSIEL